MLLPVLGGFWLLPPRDFPQFLRVTLWITTAIHLDTPESRLAPFFRPDSWLGKLHATGPDTPALRA